MVDTMYKDFVLTISTLIGCNVGGNPGNGTEQGSCPPGKVCYGTNVCGAPQLPSQQQGETSTMSLEEYAANIFGAVVI